MSGRVGPCQTLRPKIHDARVTGSTKIKKNSGKKNTEGFGPYLDLLKNWKMRILGQLRGLTEQ